MKDGTAGNAGTGPGDEVVDLLRVVVARLDTVSTRLDSLEEAVARAAQEQEHLLSRLSSLTKDVRRVPHAVDAALTLHELVEKTVPRVPAAGWALSLPVLLDVVATLLRGTPGEVVVECGSGVSTPWLAAALQQRGAGRLVVLEHLPEFADQARRTLRAGGLSDVAEVHLAPLVPARLPDREALWYDVRDVALDGGVGLLLVDGPPGATGPHARYPAFPLLAEHLVDGATVVLDDAGRPDEKDVVDGWLGLGPHGRRLVDRRTVERAEAFRVLVDGEPATTGPAPRYPTGREDG